MQKDILNHVMAGRKEKKLRLGIKDKKTPAHRYRSFCLPVNGHTG